MSSDSSTEDKPKLMQLVGLGIIGCFLLTVLNIMINTFAYGKQVVKLKKNLDDYKKEDCISNDDAISIDMYQTFKWNIIPSIFNLIIIGAIIFFTVRMYNKPK
jgi:large-conductance mechanosensitive channel